MLTAQSIGADAVIVEHDEDVEVVFSNHRIYAQVKTRAGPLIPSDIQGALDRFGDIRKEHIEGRRTGSASFVVVTNSTLGPALAEQVAHVAWPTDVAIEWPGKTSAPSGDLPRPWVDMNAALAHCTTLAASLPYSALAPDTLVWKLAGNVTAAASGTPPRTDHTFRVAELPKLFEQVVVQLQEFPAPPEIYRPLAAEPPLQSAHRIRVITGHSGAGKTSWVSQAAMHALGTVAYFDVSETPGPSLASALGRELAARLLDRGSGRLGEILLPGSNGPEILQRISGHLAQIGEQVTVVIDNAHRIPPPDLQAVVECTSDLSFVLLCHPGRQSQELEVRLSLTTEALQGWSVDTIAEEVAGHGCHADYAACERLLKLTGGLPLYVLNAVTTTAAQYGGSIAKYCDDLEGRTHLAETAQELILGAGFNRLNDTNRDVLGALSIADTPLSRKDVSRTLLSSLGHDEKTVAVALRALRSAGYVDIFGSDRLKVHDAIRLIGQTHLERRKLETKVKSSLRDTLLDSLQDDWSLQKVSLLVRMLAETNQIKTLVEMATDELFHELGIYEEIEPALEKASTSAELDPEQRFWALDGLVFADVKRGRADSAARRLDVMEQLVATEKLGSEEPLSLSMKRMNVLAGQGDAKTVLELMKRISEQLPDKPEHQRIFRYNAANALYHLGRYEAAGSETSELIMEYYDVIGLTPKQVMGRNPDKLWPLVKRNSSIRDDLKHLADCLDLHAKAMNAVGGDSPFGRIHAMKFYQMANAIDSLVKVGQDVVDEFVNRNDFVGAREMMETNLLRHVVELKMLGRIIPVRSQYAVVLAYCGDFEAASAEMKRLKSYEAGLDERGREELARQEKLIAEIRAKGPPPQWVPKRMPTVALEPKNKIGRNSQCPCGSGKKYKKCHGAPN